MSKIRLGIVGCGGMAGSHAKGYLELSDRLIITVTCDLITERAQAAADALGTAQVFKCYQDLVDHVDAVLIALPHDLHFEVGMFFLHADKHVLMEKPMCNTEEECLKLTQTADELGKILMVAYPVRFWPVVLKVKELIDSKAYGDCFQLSVWTEQYTRYEEGHWALSADRLGGGQFFSHGCHYVDLLLWFLGNPVRGTHLGTNYGTPWMEKEGTSSVSIAFESGAMGYHFGTWGARGTRLGWSLHAHCTEGMLEINLREGKLYAHTGLNPEKADLNNDSQTKVLMEFESGKFTQFETMHFLDCIETGQKPITDGLSSLQGLRVIWKLYEAEHNDIVADLRGLGLEAITQ
ncbi:Gfo/Idh/MocA family protein [Paenibacillus sp. PAMC21692]|uniref:Gfo/Idh/MocA family protein n=1 Tax=Paenibacillus sp. PAMC21692 TaxID=2762320 RepID=UPI00164E0F48|nr:Gfo/Idh/MocA family oxidoreductase [Paenibacillus sp. PAMC21692]QNK57222.1 Gfo/Idh/MocA family oxidoreductase [Paenibacillus sp. PAMC21692]